MCASDEIKILVTPPVKIAYNYQKLVKTVDMFTTDLVEPHIATKKY